MTITKEVANLCRLCMGKTETLESTGIFLGDKNYSLKIMSTLGVEIHSSDQLPKQMCPSCVYQLEKFYIFRRQCRRTDSKFRSFVRKVKSKKITRLDELSDDDEEDTEDSDMNVAFVQEYERNLYQGPAEDEINRQIVRERQKLLEQVKAKLHVAVASLAENDLAETIGTPEKVSRSSPRKSVQSPVKRSVNSSCGSVDKKPRVYEMQIDEVPVTLQIDDDDEDGEYVLDPDMAEDSNAEQEEEEEAVNESDTNVNTQLEHHCTKCSRKFNSEQKLVKHLQDHLRQKHVCEYCSKCFSTSGSLSRHMNTHTANTLFPCDVCGKEFSQKSSMKRHLLMHDVSKQVFPCDQCDKKFAQRHQLTEHKNIKHNEATHQFRCSECPKSFNYSSGLSRHLLVHSGKGFECEKCQKSLSDYSSLQRHMKLVHKGEE